MTTATPVQPLMLTANSAATYLGISLREVRRLVKDGELDIKYVGKKSSREYRIIRASCDAYFESLPSEPRAAS